MAPDGFGWLLTVRRAALRQAAPIMGECTSCRRGYCCACLALPHPGRSCAAAASAAEAWAQVHALPRSPHDLTAISLPIFPRSPISRLISTDLVEECAQFLRAVAAAEGGDTAAEGGGECGGESGGGLKDVAALLLRLEHSKADREYTSKHCRRCPGCARLIEKLSGCDAMVCGRDYHGEGGGQGCGRTFAWSELPEIQVILPEIGLLMAPDCLLIACRDLAEVYAAARTLLLPACPQLMPCRRVEHLHAGG